MQQVLTPVKIKLLGKKKAFFLSDSREIFSIEATVVPTGSLFPSPGQPFPCGSLVSFCSSLSSGF